MIIIHKKIGTDRRAAIKLIIIMTVLRNVVK